MTDLSELAELVIECPGLKRFQHVLEHLVDLHQLLLGPGEERNSHYTLFSVGWGYGRIHEFSSQCGYIHSVDRVKNSHRPLLFLWLASKVVGMQLP